MPDEHRRTARFWLIGSLLVSAAILLAIALAGRSLLPKRAEPARAPVSTAMPDAAPPSMPAPPPQEVRRYPNIEAPGNVIENRPFSVQVSLTMEPLSTGVVVQPGSGSDADRPGLLTMRLPPRPDGKPWRIQVVLNAPNFEIAGGANSAFIDLPADGDSSPALFSLTAKWPAPSAKISATFWLDGVYLARATRAIQVGPQSAAPTALVTTPAAIEASSAAPPDLTVYVQESRAGGHTACQMTVASPYLAPATSSCIPAEELRPWLAQQYAAILRLSETFRGVKVLGSAAPETPEQAQAELRGIGRELYRRAAPPLFQNAFWKLVDLQKKDGFQFQTIQIYTNNPALPWELMVPNGNGRSRDGFLGAEFRVARWHIADEVSAHDRPLPELALRQVAAIVPAYANGMALAHQSDEVAALRELAGFRQVNAQFSGIQQLLRDPPEGIVHFAGHGVAEPEPGGGVDYAIQLENGASLDLTAWRGLVRDAQRNHPLYFLNACDVGQANRVLNFVDGWAPAVLDSGGSGFIGGLWPLSDKGAAAFAGHFYHALNEAMRAGQPAVVSSLLEDARRQFYRTGDPTFLGYVFYGDVNLSISRP